MNSNIQVIWHYLMCKSPHSQSSVSWRAQENRRKNKTCDCVRMWKVTFVPYSKALSWNLPRDVGTIGKFDEVGPLELVFPYIMYPHRVTRSCHWRVPKCQIISSIPPNSRSTFTTVLFPFLVFIRAPILDSRPHWHTPHSWRQNNKTVKS
jgi:hypothetical protein